MSQETIDPPKMTMTLPRLTSSELQSIVHYSQARIKANNLADYSFHDWLTNCCIEEMERRLVEGTEPSMLSVPTGLRPIQMASFLEGAFSLSRCILTDAVSKFVDELELHVVVCASSYLQQCEPIWEAANGQ